MNDSWDESEERERSYSQGQLIRTGTGYKDLTEACHSSFLSSNYYFGVYFVYLCRLLQQIEAFSMGTIF